MNNLNLSGAVSRIGVLSVVSRRSEGERRGDVCFGGSQVPDRADVFSGLSHTHTGLDQGRGGVHQEQLNTPHAGFY